MKNVPLKRVEVYLGNDLIGIMLLDRNNWVDRKLRNWLVEQAIRRYITEKGLLIRSRKKFNEIKRMLKDHVRIVVRE